MLMEKIVRYFPLNRAVRTRDGKTLIKTIGSYLVVWIVPYIVMSLTGRVPLIGNLLYHLFRVWEYYVLAGIALSCYQYFSKMDYSNITYINVADFQRLWSHKQYRIALIAAACIIALIPHGRNVKVQQRIEETNSKTAETVIIEEKETAEEVVEQEEALIITQEQKDFYEDIKGYWKGDDIQYAFSRWKDQYFFIYCNSNRDNIGRLVYQVDSYEKADGKTQAVLSGQDSRVYDLEIFTDDMGKRALKIKAQGESDWVHLTENTFYSCQELLDAGEYKSIWLDDLAYSDLSHVTMYIESLNIGKKAVYCLLDVTEQYEGDELIIKDDGWIYVMGIRDGFLQPIYKYLSYMTDEFYDADNKTLWFYDRMGAVYVYRRSVYDEEKDVWESVGQKQSPESYDKVFFCEIGKDYQEALQEAFREEEERLAREEQERADATITFDESMVITESIESYLGEYTIQTFSIEINTIDEDSCSIKIVSGIHAVGIGKRVTGNGIPDGMAVYSVAGKVLTDNHGNSSNASYAVMLVLKPDGNIFIQNLMDLNPSFELPEGTYRRE